MQLGISSFTFGWAVGVAGFEAPAAPLGALDLLERARELQVSLVQFGDNLPLHQCSHGEREQVKARALALGLTLEVGARGMTETHLARTIQIAHDLTAPLLRFVVDQNDFEPSPAQIVQILRGALPDLGALKIGIENHDRLSAQSLREIIESVDDERVGICLDSANSLGAGEGLEHVLNALAPFTLNWHLKDYAIARLPYLMGFSVEGRPAGAGDLDFELAWRALESGGRCQSAILELWTPPESSMKETIEKEARWAQQSVAWLRTWRDWT